MVLDLCIFLSWLRLFQWRKQYYGLRTEVTVWISNFIYYKHAIFCFKYVNRWTGVVWIIVMFLSAVWTLILTAPIHWGGSIGEQVMECYISLNLFPWRNKRIYFLNGLRVSKFSSNFHDCVTVPLSASAVWHMKFKNCPCTAFSLKNIQYLVEVCELVCNQKLIRMLVSPNRCTSKEC